MSKVLGTWYLRTLTIGAGLLGRLVAPRPSGGAGASSRCAGARGRGSARRRIRREAGGRRCPRARSRRAPPASARAPLHVGAKLVAAEDRQLVAGRSRVLDRVVEPAEVAVHRLAPADRLDEPELLEVRRCGRGPRQAARGCPSRRVLSWSSVSGSTRRSVLRAPRRGAPRWCSSDRSGSATSR